MRFNVPPAVSQLKSRWNRLSFLEQAEAINDLVNRGISRRALARELGCSEALLRHIQKASSLPASVKESILTRRISFRAAITSSKEPPKLSSKLPTLQCKVELVSSTRPPSIKVSQPTNDAKGWAKLIVEFAIKKYSTDRGDCHQLIKEAGDVAHAIPNPKRLNIRPLPPEASVEYVIEHSRPERQLDAFTDVSRWLAGWLLMLVPDKQVRYEALELAIRDVSH